ncbi:SGNH/GDSL hydrolase family protein [Flavitalea antarctica]
MIRHICLFLVILLASWKTCFSQSPENYKSWDPAASKVPVIDGRAWHNELAMPYDRLPAKAEKTVRPEVWRLSHNSAGEYIRFRSDASEIVIRYKVTGNKSMNHMPATGVSGVDLYALDVNGNWHWVRGSFSFGDTVVYKFNNFFSTIPVKEFRLYLPLYNTPEWMKIEVPTNNTFDPIPVSDEKPIVLYGTSIMQGACASRPGLAWGNILGRRLGKKVINLGFSGNGRLEQPLIDLINETDASLFVLDCQPNLHDRKTYTANEISERIRTSVTNMRKAHPQTPVLLVEHCCGLPGVNMDTSFISRYSWTSDILSNTFKLLKGSGVKNIYLLTADDIGFDSESTVDGTHPTDIGMMKYAQAYEKVIRKIPGFDKTTKGSSKATTKSLKPTATSPGAVESR